MSIDKVAKLIKKGNADKLGQILQNPDFDVNELEPKCGKTLLQIAIQCEQQQAFDLLLKTKGIKLDTISKQGETALQTAILMNSINFVEQILRVGGSTKRKNWPGESPLIFSIKNKSTPAIVLKLISSGFDVNEAVPKYGSMLNLTITTGQFQIFSLLLANPSIDLKMQDEEENTSLLLAVREKRGQFVQTILKKLEDTDVKCGLDKMEKQFYMNSCDRNGDTALHLAARKDNQVILDILLKKGLTLGMDPKIKNKQGKTYLEISQETAEEKQRQRLQEQYQQKKRVQERRIKNKEKQEERIRVAKQQEMMAVLQKKKRKEEQILEATKRQLSIKMERNKKIWLLGMAAIVIVGVLYIVFLSASKPKQSSTI